MFFNEIIKKTLKQQQQFFDASYKTAVIAQGHFEQTTKTVFEQAQIPSDSLGFIINTLHECSKSRDSIKKNIDDNYDSLQVFFK